MATVSKDTFIRICDAFSENVDVYRQIDELIEYSYRRREYYKKSIEQDIGDIPHYYYNIEDKSRF